MTRRRASLAFLPFSAALVLGLLSVEREIEAADTLSARLTDREFWNLVTDFSEPDGTFHSENLVSNEVRFQTVIPELVKRVPPGRAYIGVGSEQNFTYIAAVRPAMAFIVDIRRGNLDLHLLYKAIFELSADRAEFVSRLFSRPRPSGLTTAATAAAIFDAYRQTVPSESLYQTNLRAIEAHLLKRHGFRLSSGDRDGLAFVYRAWFSDGPDIRYSLTAGGGRGGGFPTYFDLMTATDGAGQPRSYLATEAAFRFLKDLQTRNMLVPVVGNFGGPKALAAVARYLKARQATVSVFYVSNVEQYLERDGIWSNFCANAAAMPIDRASTFIRSERGGFGGRRVGGGGFALELVPMAGDVAACATR
jgi:hypothetical protein